MELVVTLLLIGAVLLLLETVLPGMIAGILGLCSITGGVIAAYVEFGSRVGNWVLLGVTFAIIGGFAAWLRLFPRSRLGRAFISERTVGNIDAEKPELLHQTGEALSTLRPAGTALIAGKRVDVVTEGSLIEKGTPIKVVATEGLRVVVRAISVTREPVHRATK